MSTCTKVVLSTHLRVLVLYLSTFLILAGVLVLILSTILSTCMHLQGKFLTLKDVD